MKIEIKNTNITLTTVLGWGSLDLEFLENKINELDLNIDDVLNKLESNDFNKTDINSWIYCTLLIGANNFLVEVEKFAEINELEFNKDLVDIEIYTNYLDSFLNGEVLNSDIDITNFSNDNLKSFINKVMEA